MIDKNIENITNKESGRKRDLTKHILVLVFISVVLLFAFLFLFLFLNNSDASVGNKTVAVYRQLPPKAEERWAYIKALENKQLFSRSVLEAPIEEMDIFSPATLPINNDDDMDIAAIDGLDVTIGKIDTSAVEKEKKVEQKIQKNAVLEHKSSTPVEVALVANPVVNVFKDEKIVKQQQDLLKAVTSADKVKKAEKDTKTTKVAETRVVTKPAKPVTKDTTATAKVNVAKVSTKTAKPVLKSSEADKKEKIKQVAEYRVPTYVFQCGSFKTKSVAEKARIKLSNAGLQGKIESTKNGYSVVTQSIKQGRELDRARNILKNASEINCLLQKKA